MDPSPAYPSQGRMLGLKLTPQEDYLYQHHLQNLQNDRAVHNPDGSTSTILQIGTTIDGRYYNVPSVWDGRILPPKEAIDRAKAEGLRKWPSYPDQATAEARYAQMHDVMEQDVKPPMGQILVNPKTKPIAKGKSQYPLGEMMEK